MEPFELSQTFFEETLATPAASIAYETGRRLAALRPGKFVLETDSASFDVDGALEGGAVRGGVSMRLHGQVLQRFSESEDRFERVPENVVFELLFEGRDIEVVVITYPMGDCTERRSFVIADDAACAQALVRHVTLFASEVRGEVLVFEGGGWRKDEQLFSAIHRADMEGLVLRGSLKHDIVADVTGFFDAAKIYERYRVPHKRGVLLYGPPGNGKTHFLKALLKEIDRPCLYVKSLEGSYKGDHESIRRIFSRARRAAPCMLVFEDLETILKDENRSFFLNELDGFADNSGIVTLATTNYPEQIDPAIIDRPSRFDRKYLFDLPAGAERVAYLERWSASLEPEMKMSTRGISRAADGTAGFSFAYLKELTLSATMAWIREARDGAMDSVVSAVLEALDEQVKRGRSPGQSRNNRRVGLVPQA
jgi:hypothetical protein